MSVTAHIINTGSAPKFGNLSQFSALRNQAGALKPPLLTLLNNLNQGYKFLNPNYFVLGEQEKQFKELAKQYLGFLEQMKKNGIFNCEEFAWWALLQLTPFCNDHSLLNTSGNYTVHYAVLKDYQLSSPKFDEKYFPGYKEQLLDHDHVFVAIKDGHRQVQYVVDLGQSQLDSTHRTAFIGTAEDFINRLEVDGRYVARGVQNTAAIQTEDQLLSKLLRK